jgi:hypothetical protein
MEDLERIVEELELENDTRSASDPLVKKSLEVVAEFLRNHPVLCYGGTAINNLLPPEDQFYDPETTIPDYDFYSRTPQEHSMILANQLAAIGIQSVEVRPGMHLGTFKVFANYEAVADITHLDTDIFDRLWKENVVDKSIHYVGPNFLRMSMYLELSRPRGDVSRWTKVYGRLQLLNKRFPMTCPMKEMEERPELTDARRKKVISILKNNNVVLLGITASQIHEGKGPKWASPITILAEPETRNRIVKPYVTHAEDGTDILPSHVDIIDEDGGILVRIHETAACHSYHEMANGIKVASIPTMLQFALAYMYSGVSEDEITHLMCVSQRLVDLASHKEKRRYAILTPKDCLGEQDTVIDIRRNKAKLYARLSEDKSSADFLKFFFAYNPAVPKTERQTIKKQLRRTRKARYESSY